MHQGAICRTEGSSNLKEIHLAETNIILELNERKITFKSSDSLEDRSKRMELVTMSQGKEAKDIPISESVTWENRDAVRNAGAHKGTHYILKC